MLHLISHYFLSHVWSSWVFRPSCASVDIVGIPSPSVFFAYIHFFFLIIRNLSFQNEHLESSLASQWLGPGAFVAATWVWSLAGELRSHKSRGMAKKKVSWWAILTSICDLNSLCWVVEYVHSVHGLGHGRLWVPLFCLPQTPSSARAEGRS